MVHSCVNEFKAISHFLFFQIQGVWSLLMFMYLSFVYDNRHWYIFILLYATIQLNHHHCFLISVHSYVFNIIGNFHKRTRILKSLFNIITLTKEETTFLNIKEAKTLDNDSILEVFLVSYWHWHFSSLQQIAIVIAILAFTFVFHLGFDEYYCIIGSRVVTKCLS